LIESSKVFNSHRPLGGILFCIFALLLFAIQDSIIKGLSGQYPILEILLLRSVIVFVLLVAIGVFLQGVAILRGRNPLPLLVRGVLAFFAFTSYYIALQKIPLADAAAVFLTAPCLSPCCRVYCWRKRLVYIDGSQ